MYEEILKDVASSDCILTEKLRHLYDSADVKSDYEALVALFHHFMLESGFIPKDVTNTVDKYKCMPKNWKSNGVFKILYQYACCQPFICSMTCIPMYNTLTVHGILCDIACSESVSMKVEIGRFLKKRRDFSSAFKVFKNCNELSIYFKDNFCLPLLNLLHENSSCVHMYGLRGLFDEIKVFILQLLPVESVVSMSAVNKNFNTLANLPCLWKYLYLRDFAKDGVPDVDAQSETNWKQIYKKEYAKKKRSEHRCFVVHPYRLPQFFPGPDLDFDLNIGFNPPPPLFFPSFRDPYSRFPPQPPFFPRR